MPNCYKACDLFWVRYKVIHVDDYKGRHKQESDYLIIYTCVPLFFHHRYSSHEEAIGELAREMGFSHVSLSSQVMPMVRMVPRGYTG